MGLNKNDALQILINHYYLYLLLYNFIMSLAGGIWGSGNTRKNYDKKKEQNKKKVFDVS